jgi:RTA1 like protein
VSPVFFSASIYTILSFLIEAAGHQYSPVRPSLILFLFIACDVVATAVQIGGAASIGTAEANRQDPNTASHVLTAGLVFQVFSFLLFIILLSTFLYRARKVCGKATIPFTAALVAGTLLVYLRTCFRLVESAQGVQQYLFTHEAFFASLEFAPIVIAVFIFNAFHPGNWVPKYGAVAQI